MSMLRQRLVRKGWVKPMDMTPYEIEQLIITRTSEAALLRYQESVGKGIAPEIAAFIRGYAKGFARSGDLGGARDSGVIDVLTEVAGTVEGSVFPSELITVKEED